jgi:hypothetical protein
MFDIAYLKMLYLLCCDAAAGMVPAAAAAEG